MKLNKRKKYSRMKGTRTCGWAMKKHKGSGNRGGFGMAGMGKRSKHRKTYAIRYMYPYFGKQGWTSGKGEKDRIKVINLRDIQSNIGRYGKPGKDGIEINLSKYKILGNGEIESKIIIKALTFSKSAKDKIEKAGGKIIVLSTKKKKEKKKAVEKAGKNKEKPEVKDKENQKFSVPPTSTKEKQEVRGEEKKTQEPKAEKPKAVKKEKTEKKK